MVDHDRTGTGHRAGSPITSTEATTAAKMAVALDLPAPGDLDGGLDAALLTALWRLPARQREVIALRIFLDLDTAAWPGRTTWQKSGGGDRRMKNVHWP